MGGAAGEASEAPRVPPGEEACFSGIPGDPCAELAEQLAEVLEAMEAHFREGPEADRRAAHVEVLERAVTGAGREVDLLVARHLGGGEPAPPASRSISPPASSSRRGA